MAKLENDIVTVRKTLKERSALGEYGAVAIRRELLTRGGKTVASERTIGRILQRRGVLDGQRRVRRPPPPKGWYLPRVSAAKAELDSFDFVEGLIIRGATDMMVLNAISLNCGLCDSWVRSSWTAKFTVQTRIAHWREQGLPDYAQVDNDTIFQGESFPHQLERSTCSWA